MSNENIVADLHKWNESDAIKLGDNIREWMTVQDENIFFDEYLYVSCDKTKYKTKIYPDLFKLLKEKFHELANIINECEGIQKAKITKFGAFDKLNSSLVKYLLNEDSKEKDKPEKKDKRIGNDYWTLRKKSGRDKIFETSEDLLDAANEYFEWIQENPLISSEVVKFKDYAELIEVPKMRPFTIEGLCNFLDISTDTFKLYENREDFIGITSRIRQIIYNQKFEGAASGFLNPNIIARSLGLTDKTDVTSDGAAIAAPVIKIGYKMSEED